MSPLSSPRRSTVSVHIMGRDEQHPTISDVARAAGVSRAVVSRVLRDDPGLHVRPATRERVLAAAAELDYVPNHSAQALRWASPGALALIVHEITNPLYAEIMDGAQRAAFEAGYVVLVTEARDMARNEAAFRRLVGSRRIEGVVFQSGGAPEDTSIKRISRARLPTIVINAETTADTVVLDDVAAGRVAAEHLLELGHREIGYLGGLSTQRWNPRRRQGLVAALAGAGLRLNPRWTLEAGWDEKGGHDAMQRLLSRPSRPTAILVGNVMAALGALAAAQNAGVRVPSDLSIVTIHDTWFARLTSPPLTAVKVPLYEMAYAGVESLLQLLRGGSSQALVISDPPPELIQRGSTAPP